MSRGSICKDKWLTKLTKAMVSPELPSPFLKITDTPIIHKVRITNTTRGPMARNIEYIYL